MNFIFHRPIQNGKAEKDETDNKKDVTSAPHARVRFPGQARPVGLDGKLCQDGVLIRAKIDNVRYHLGREIGTKRQLPNSLGNNF